MVRAYCIAGCLALSLEAVTGQNEPGTYTDVICPFLSTLVQEKAIPVQDYYEREELLGITLSAGLDQTCTQNHIHSQFRNIRSNRIDIFNMEGLPIEHHTSSGINDCDTDFTHYDQCPVGPVGSATQGVRICETVACEVPSSYRSLGFWDHFDPSKTGYLTTQNLKRLASTWLGFSNDVNEDPGVLGKIDDAYTFLINVFAPRTANGGADRISYQDFERVVMARMYPVSYTYGRGCSTNKTQTLQQAFPYYSAEPFGIRDSYGRYLALSGSVGVVVSDDKTVWTAAATDEGVSLRAAGPTIYEAGLMLSVDGHGGVSGSADEVTSWEAIQDKDKVLIKAVDCGGLPCSGFLSADTYGNVVMSNAASVNSMFELVYCSLPASEPHLV